MPCNQVWKLSALPDDFITEAVISLCIVIVCVLSSRACCNLRGFSYGIGFWTLLFMALCNLSKNNKKTSSGSVNCDLFISSLFMNYLTSDMGYANQQYRTHITPIWCSCITVPVMND